MYWTKSWNKTLVIKTPSENLSFTNFLLRNHKKQTEKNFAKAFVSELHNFIYTRKIIKRNHKLQNSLLCYIDPSLIEDTFWYCSNTHWNKWTIKQHLNNGLSNTRCLQHLKYTFHPVTLENVVCKANPKVLNIWKQQKLYYMDNRNIFSNLTNYPT